MAKRTVRLTESELKHIITESVNKILEGKYTQNKPYFFNYDAMGDSYEVAPGQKARGQFDDRAEMEEVFNNLDMSDLGYTPDETEAFKEKTRKKEEKRFKHNDRLEKYNGAYSPNFGESRDFQRTLQQRGLRKQMKKDLNDMLNFWEVDYETFKSMPNSDKMEYWRVFYYVTKNKYI